MTADEARQTLMQVVGVLEYLRAGLSRAEHGPDRATIAQARRTLQTQAEQLLLLRARIGAPQDGRSIEPRQ